MRIVSYVRKTSFDPTDKNPSDLETQTENIRMYVKERHWRISKRYSDRRNDPEESAGYLEMKNASLRREFDCIVVDSISRFGPDVYQTLRFLKNSFYPAGLHFAVAEDGFCSLDHTDEEVYAYIDEKRAFIHGRMVVTYTKEAAVESYFSAYGFRYDREGHVVERDEPSANIVREVYKRLKDGELPSSIARDMTERGIETPGHYYYRQRGFRQKTDDPSWNTRSVRAITKNPKYMGRWECDYDLTKLDIRCGAIVDPELFEAVQQMYASRFDHVAEKKKPAPYTNLMQDKETGKELRYFSNSRAGKQDIRFRHSEKAEVQYEKASMSGEEFHDKVARQLLQEKQAAVNALDMIKSESGSIRKEKRMRAKREKFLPILEKMTLLENEKMDAYRKYQKGEIRHDDYRQQETAIAGKLKELDQQVERLASELADIEKVFSEKNPWIKLFAGFEAKDAMVRKRIVKLVEKILLYRFESVELIPKELMWKQALPQEWIREGCHGEKEQEE